MKLFFRNVQHDYRSPYDPSSIGINRHRNFHDDHRVRMDLTYLYLLKNDHINHKLFLNEIKNDMYMVPYSYAIRYSWDTFHLSDNNGPMKRLKLKNKYRK